MINPKSTKELVNLLINSKLVHRDGYESWRAGRSELEFSLASDLANALVEDGIITRWQADHLLSGRWKGFQLKKYVITGLVRVGRGASDFSAIDTETGKHVVLEVRPPSSGLRSDGLPHFSLCEES